jgi:hypothetical protein
MAGAPSPPASRLRFRLGQDRPLLRETQSVCVILCFQQHPRIRRRFALRRLGAFAVTRRNASARSQRLASKLVAFLMPIVTHRPTCCSDWPRPYRKSTLQLWLSVAFSRTMYHESRHAEQYFRIAQGLAVGRREFPQPTGLPFCGPDGVGHNSGAPPTPGPGL